VKLKRFSVLLLILATLTTTFFLYDPEPTFTPAPPVVRPSEEALRIHHEAIVIDLHVDSLLWPRDLTIPGQGGHVDFPRMKQGGLDAVAFTIVTRFFGVAGLKAFHDLWPPASWFSPHPRYLHQLHRMQQFIQSSNQTVRLATTPEAIRQNHQEGILSAFHGIEGAHGLGTELSRVREAAQAGVIFISPVHLSNNEYAGTSTLGSNQGLTDLGRALIREMNQVGVLVDLAHASPTAFDEALELTTLPPLVSHAGARAVHDTWRNLSDDQIRAIAERRGVIGVMLAPPALASPDLREAVEHLEHIINVGGEDVAAIGSDFDGYVNPSIDASGLGQLTELMLRKVWSEARIKKILGENVLRIMASR
jgi:microsomal dipeptidase-like Zn-dependent dipeptidase